MMPWNPIHRYAGLQSAIDLVTPEPATGGPSNGVTAEPFGSSVPHASETSFGHASGRDGVGFTDSTRRPLGFIDVRGETGADSEHAADAGDVEHGDAVGVDGTEESGGEVERKIPFYKRELNFGRRKTDEAPAVEADSVAAEQRSMAEPVSEPGAAAADSESAVEGAVEPDSTEAQVAADEKVPFFNHEPAPNAADAMADEPQTVEIVANANDAVATAELDAVESDTAEEDAADENMAYEQVHDAGAELEWPEHEALADETVSSVASVEDVADETRGADLVPAPIEIPVAVASAKPTPRSFGRSRSTKPSSGGRGSSRRSGRVVGLKIGASQLAAAVVEEQNGRPELVELARSPLEAGIVVDGEIRDPEALTNALRTFFADHSLPTRDVRIGIASNRIGVRTFEIAGIDDDARFDNAVRFKAHEVLPIAGNESVLDYRVLDERRAPTGETTRRIFLVVAPRDQLAPYAEVAQRAGLKLTGIDLESLGLLRAFVEPQDPGDRKATDTATVVVAIGHEASTLMVSGGGVCEFTRVFDWGGSTLQEAISQELDLRPAEAATILRHLSLSGGSLSGGSLSGGSARIEGLDDEARTKAIEAVRLRLTPFSRELVSSLQFYQTQPDSLGIGEIVITGGTSQLDGLADALNQMIGVAVRVGDPLQRVAARKGVETGFEPVIGSLAVAIGLGIDDGAVRSVDLTPRDLAKVSTNKPRLLPVLLPIAAVVPLAAVGFLFFQAHGKVSDRQSQLSSLEAEFASLPQPRRPQIDAALQGLQAQRASAVAQVLGARTAWDAMLTDFALVLPSNVWLTALSAKTARPLSAPTVVATSATPAPTPAAAPAVAPVSPTGVTITGYTYALADVARLLARLSALPSLQNVQLQGSQVTAVGKRDVVSFTILADLRETGGGS